MPDPRPKSASVLPVPLTGFVGRARDVPTVARLLAESRLVTLTGAGGSGKTRLAIAVATAIEQDAKRDVMWVELAALDDPSTLASHVALALGVRVEGGGSPEQALIAWFHDRPVLLVLDNCEHLVAACASLVEQLLRATPSLQVLATSREALGVGGERSWLVPALSLPDTRAPSTAAEAMGSDAVRLFVERARDVLSDFTLTESNCDAVVQICRRLDGLPLAIELAAARVAVLPPAQLAERLHDRFGLLTSSTRSALPRHRTLRAAVDWSFDLLNEEEQVLLERLSVFAGGFTLDAAETVCADDVIPAERVLDLVAALATRSLVAMQEDEGRARYRLLETIREYAAERRGARGSPDDLGARHARYFLQLARDAEPELILGRSWRLRQMDVEHDNLRAALTWSAAAGAGGSVGLPLAWALMWYWFHRQLWREGFAHFDTALTTATNPSGVLRAAALHGLGIFGLYAADPRSRVRLEEADRLWRDAGEHRWRCFTLLVRTTEASLRHDAVGAQEFAQEAVSVARAVGAEWETALMIAHALVPSKLWAEEWGEADTLLEEAERVYRKHDYTIGVAYVLDARAFTSLQLGEPDRAVHLACASLREEPTGQNRWLAGRSLRTLGAVAAEGGDLARALRLFGAAAAMYEAIGARALTEERRAVNVVPDALRASMPAVEFAEGWEAGRALSFADAVALALAGDVPAPPSVAENRQDAATQATPPVALSPAATPHAPPLEIRTLGRVEILRSGVLMPEQEWPYARPRELLLYLVAHPEGRTREQVGLDFWPDVSAAQVKNSFHVTLHHLRKALGGAEWIRFHRGRYRVAFETGVVHDAADFERDVTSALRTLRRSPADPQATEMLAAALASHRGPFLEEESATDWQHPVRDRVARLFEDGMLALGAVHSRSGRPAEAAACYRRLVTADPLHEEATRLLMLALARDNRRSEALRVYERLVHELARELEAEPNADLVAAADRIRDGSALDGAKSRD